jgi:predicted SnoaL-like aldol condensation-catalyzing enzyme
MKKYLTCVAGTLLFGLATIAHADAVEPRDMVDANTPNGKLVVEWLTAMFGSCNDPDAFRKMFEKNVDKANYKNHPPAEADQGDELTMESGVSRQMCGKGIKIDIKQVVVSGDRAVLMAAVWRDDIPKENATALVEWIRVKNGKIVDHWDMSRKMQGNQSAF